MTLRPIKSMRRCLGFDISNDVSVIEGKLWNIRYHMGQSKRISMQWVASQRGVRVNAVGAEGAISQRDISINGDYCLY